MAEAHVTHVLATIHRVSELAAEHDREHRHAAIAVHRDTLAELAGHLPAQPGGPMAHSPSTTPDTGRR